MAFSFGTPTTNTQSATPFSFGSATPAQNNPSSLFGNQQNTPSTTFSFGNPSNNQQQAQAQAKPAFSFGASTSNTGNNTNQPFSFNNNNSNTNNTAGSGLFGQNNQAGQPNSTAQPTAFGQQGSNGGGGLFGQQNTNATGGLFGQSNGAQSNQTNAGNGLFGQQSTNSAGTGLFGQPNQAQSGSNLFGQTAKQGSGLFGNNQTTTNSGGLFGQSVNNSNQQSTSLFGAVQHPPANQVQGSLGTQSQQAQSLQVAQTPQPSLTQSVYGQTSSQPQFSWSRPNQGLSQSVMPSFSMPSSSLTQSKFNPSQTHNPAAANAVQNSYGPSQPASIQDQLLRLKNAWDPSNPDCMFQAYFYNRVAPETASLYTKPDDHKQAAWDTAVANRPDNSVVPVLARGFSDLQARLQGQEQQIQAYRTRIHEIANKLKELADRHTLHATPKIDTARRRHIEISRRALQLAAKVQMLKCRGYALRPEEEQLRTTLMTLDNQIHDPTTFGRVDELWAKMTLVKLQQKSMEEDIKSRGYISTIDFESGDGLQHVETVLLDHQNGIEYISRVLKDDLDKVQNRIQQFSSKQAGLDKSKGRT